MTEQPEGEIRFIGDLQRLELKPGDILVLKVDFKLSDSARNALYREIRAAFPDHRILILDTGIDMGVLSPTLMDEG